MKICPAQSFIFDVIHDSFDHSRGRIQLPIGKIIRKRFSGPGLVCHKNRESVFFGMILWIREFTAVTIRHFALMAQALKNDYVRTDVKLKSDKDAKR